MKIVPQAFYQARHIKKIMVDGQCGIIHKLTEKADLDNQRLLSAHALTLVLNGGLMIHTDDGLPLKVETGHMVLLPKGLYAITDLIPQEATFEAVVFIFDDELIEQFLTSKGMSSSYFFAARVPGRSE